MHARKASNPAVPAAAPESSTFIVVGFGEQGQIVAEHKDTFDRISFAPVASFNDCAGDTPVAAVPALSPAGLLTTALALALALAAAMLGRGTRAVGRSN